MIDVVMVITIIAMIKSCSTNEKWDGVVSGARVLGLQLFFLIAVVCLF